MKKPLLRLGAKGASISHGNSLKQLLEDHTAVKVKVDPKPYDGKQFSFGSSFVIDSARLWSGVDEMA